MNENIQPNPEAESRMIDELKAILLEMAERNAFQYIDRIGSFNRELGAEYDDKELRRYKLYHVLASSTFDERSTEFDLPGGRIEKFIRELHVDEGDQE